MKAQDRQVEITQKSLNARMCGVIASCMLAEHHARSRTSLNGGCGDSPPPADACRRAKLRCIAGHVGQPSLACSVAQAGASSQPRHQLRPGARVAPLLRKITVDRLRHSWQAL